MSTFAGRMKEYPHISLDCFDHENLEARAYFLSHCHKDHMRGIRAPKLQRRLKSSRRVKLYCSPVTKELLLSSRKHLFWEDYIVPLELDSPTQISLVDEASGESEEMVVTLLPAGHCPGSVMFLFEGRRGNVLYTGDFRLAPGDAARMEHLHSGGGVKDIQSVYVDSTFFDPRFYQIPSREACVDAIVRLAGDWIARSARHAVWLNCKAAYGYEYLFARLAERFGTRVHVNNLLMFRRMPEILSYVTAERRTRLHACRHPKESYTHGNRLPCGRGARDGTRVLSIKPSTMWFGERTRKSDIVIKSGSDAFRACFSFHSSYSEIRDFLCYLRPVRVFPNVVPMGRTLAEVTDMLQTTCRAPPREKMAYKPLGALKRGNAERATCDSVSDDDDLFDGAAAPPLRKKPTESGRVAIERGRAPAAAPSAREEISPRRIETESECTEDRNYVDCTESNDDSDGYEESDEDDERRPPKWEDFFGAEPPPDGPGSRKSDDRSRPRSGPARSAQTPEDLRSEDEDFAASQGGTERGDAPSDADGSRASSDFDVPCTPESKRPTPEELACLYRKLANGDDISSC
ncbi:protein artemis isoform X2 [Corythoichthys intestinalis]|uniref:protein artemis isoform X2 n=1 Tax=Corythoichthys intestinalis TaxID=161448 RepID=UPI0025A62CAA|nr:protein artemis isoform X2 [Corythoichthys intestinalis]XP_061809603.1 protein artemis-like [Nerophis lumbriciformis]